MGEYWADGILLQGAMIYMAKNIKRTDVDVVVMRKTNMGEK